MCSLLNTSKDEIPAEDKVAALDRFVFGQPMRRDILHLCVNYYRDSLRQGTASTKTRAEVAGSGRKIRPQKGSGRARLGDAQSPMLRGGGVAFGPKPRDFGTELPRKVRQLGMRVALSAKVRENGLGVADTLEWTGLKTKGFARRIDELGWSRTLFITGGDQVPPRLARVSRNLPTVETKRAEDLHVYDALKWPRIILDVGAVDYFERALGTNLSEVARIAPKRQQSLRFSRVTAGRIGKRSPPIPGVDDRRKLRPSAIEAGIFEQTQNLAGGAAPSTPTPASQL